MSPLMTNEEVVAKYCRGLIYEPPAPTEFPCDACEWCERMDEPWNDRDEECTITSDAECPEKNQPILPCPDCGEPTPVPIAGAVTCLHCDFVIRD